MLSCKVYLRHSHVDHTHKHIPLPTRHGDPRMFCARELQGRWSSGQCSRMVRMGPLEHLQRSLWGRQWAAEAGARVWRAVRHWAAVRWRQYSDAYLHIKVTCLGVYLQYMHATGSTYVSLMLSLYMYLLLLSLLFPSSFKVAVRGLCA